MKVKVIRRVEVEMTSEEFDHMVSALAYAGTGNNRDAAKCLAMHAELIQRMNEDD